MVKTNVTPSSQPLVTLLASMHFSTLAKHSACIRQARVVFYFLLHVSKVIFDHSLPASGPIQIQRHCDKAALWKVVLMNKLEAVPEG